MFIISSLVLATSSYTFLSLPLHYFIYMYTQITPASFSIPWNSIKSYWRRYNNQQDRIVEGLVLLNSRSGGKSFRAPLSLMAGLLYLCFTPSKMSSPVLALDLLVFCCLDSFVTCVWRSWQKLPVSYFVLRISGARTLAICNLSLIHCYS